MGKIKISDMINALTHYNLEHVEFPLEPLMENGAEYMGLADDYKRKLFINKEKPFSEKRITVVHEIIHAVHYLRGDFDTYTSKKIEKLVDRETDTIMKRYFKEELNEE